MTTTNEQHHSPVEVWPGDDWIILGTVKNAAGSPLDQTNGSYQWALIDPDGKMLAAGEGITITPVEPLATSGEVRIRVPDTYTADLAAGRYHDVLRFHDSAGDRSTLWWGALLVAGNAFADTVP